MHHLAFFESQAKQKGEEKELRMKSCKAFMSYSSPTNGVEVNGDCEQLMEKTITDEMPKWQKEKIRKHNEEVRRKNEETIAQKKREEEREKQKWHGMPVWKATIMKKREEELKRQEEEKRQVEIKEQEEKAKWENLPKWKRSIYEKKGFKPVTAPQELPINQSSKSDSQVTREEPTPTNATTCEQSTEKDNDSPQENGKLGFEELNSDSEQTPDASQEGEVIKGDDNNNDIDGNNNDDDNDKDDVNNNDVNNNNNNGNNNYTVEVEQQEDQENTACAAATEHTNDEKDDHDPQKQDGSSAYWKLSQIAEQEALKDGLTAV